jgi:hypothetical protein
MTSPLRQACPQHSALHFTLEKLVYLPKSSPALGHIPEVDCPLVKYPLQGLNIFLIFPKGVFCKPDKLES